MKKLIILIILLIPLIGYSQTYLSGSDSIATKGNPATTYTVITVTDSSDSKTDSLVVEIETSLGWVPIAVQDLFTHDDWYSYIVPGDGNTRMYLVNYLKAGGALRVRRVNVEAGELARRTGIIIAGIQ